jgi:putative redox protein
VTPRDSGGFAVGEGVPKKQNRVVVRWDGEHRFDASRLGSQHRIRIDADAATGPGPVDTLLSALAACTAVDVVDILEKRRTPVQGLTIEVVGDRANAIPARLVRIVLQYRMRGAGIERVHAERAIELAVTKYCSVRDSLDPNLPVEWTLELVE